MFARTGAATVATPDAAEVVADATGRAVAKLMTSPDAAPLYYAGRLISRRPDRLEIELLHLKTNRPLEAARVPLLVKLALA